MMKRKNAVLEKIKKGGGLYDGAGDQRCRKKET